MNPVRGKKSEISADSLKANRTSNGMKYVSKSTEETNKVASNFLNTLEIGNAATVVALQGDLGAGKTAFAQEVGKILGVEENLRSPTFLI